MHRSFSCKYYSDTFKLKPFELANSIYVIQLARQSVNLGARAVPTVRIQPTKRLNTFKASFFPGTAQFSHDQTAPGRLTGAGSRGRPDHLHPRSDQSRQRTDNI